MSGDKLQDNRLAETLATSLSYIRPDTYIIDVGLITLQVVCRLGGMDRRVGFVCVSAIAWIGLSLRCNLQGVSVTTISQPPLSTSLPTIAIAGVIATAAYAATLPPPLLLFHGKGAGHRDQFLPKRMQMRPIADSPAG